MGEAKNIYFACLNSAHHGRPRQSFSDLASQLFRCSEAKNSNPWLGASLIRRASETPRPCSPPISIVTSRLVESGASSSVRAGDLLSLPIPRSITKFLELCALCACYAAAEQRCTSSAAAVDPIVVDVNQ